MTVDHGAGRMAVEERLGQSPSIALRSAVPSRLGPPSNLARSSSRASMIAVALGSRRIGRRSRVSPARPYRGIS
jgi:hypothetical protein